MLTERICKCVSGGSAETGVSGCIRLFQVASEEDAMNWFPQYALKLRPFYETLPLKAETTQPIVDCIRSHPDWSSAHIAIETGLRECLKHNYIQR